MSTNKIIIKPSKRLIQPNHDHIIVEEEEREMDIVKIMKSSHQMKEVIAMIIMEDLREAIIETITQSKTSRRKASKSTRKKIKLTSKHPDLMEEVTVAIMTKALTVAVITGLESADSMHLLRNGMKITKITQESIEMTSM